MTDDNAPWDYTVSHVPHHRTQSNFEMVQEFAQVFRAARQSYNGGFLAMGAMILKFDLIKEELNEMESAYFNHDVVEFADAVADLLYVVYGMGDAVGLPVDKLFAEVHRSNMSKSGPEGPIYRADGKVLKGPQFSPPNIKDILNSEG